MSGAAELLVTLEAAGVTVLLNASKNGLKLSAAVPPPAELMGQVNILRSALIELLTAQKQLGSNPDWASIGAQYGHCGSCARWSALPAPLAHMGLCRAGRRAHGWLDGNPAAAVEIQAGHGCMVHGGKGWRSTLRG